MKPQKVNRQAMKVVVSLGLVLSVNEWFLLTLDQLCRHIFIAGGTGGGKTMLLLLVMRQLAAQGVGFTYITPHPDGREKFLQWCVLNGIDPARIRDIHVSPECAVSIDPFAHPPKNCDPLTYKSWLNATVDRVVSAILRNVPKAEQEVMNRLKRWLKNVLYCCGCDVDGRHLGIDKSLILLDPGHPEFDGYMDRLWEHLPDEIRSDFRNLRETKKPRERESWVESTINRLRELLSSPLVRQMFGQKAPAIDDEAIILGDEIQLVSVPESDYLSRDQGNVIAGLRISSMVAAARRIGNRLPEHLRHYHFVLIDEAENFLGEDLKTGFQELRKFRMPLVVVFQDISCMVKGDNDFMGKIGSECGVQITFQQQGPESLEYLGPAFAYPNLDMRERYQLQVIPDRTLLIQTQSTSFSRSGGISVSEAESRTRTRSFTENQHEGVNFTRSLARALSSTHSEGGSVGVSQGSTWSTGRTESTQRTDSSSCARSRSVADSAQLSVTSTDTESHQQTESSGTTDSSQTSHGSGSSHSASSGYSDFRADATAPRDGRTDSRSSGNSTSMTSNESHGFSSSESRSISEGHSTSQGIGASVGRTETEGETKTEGKSFGRGTAVSDTLGGSKTTSVQGNWSDATGHTLTDGESAGSSQGTTRGQSQGESDGTTAGVSASETSGMTVSFNQVPLQLQRIIQVPTGTLVRSVQDQIYDVIRLMASLPDRTLLVKVRGMEGLFHLRVHDMRDAYEEKGQGWKVGAWRALDVKRYVALIRKASTCYFLPSFETNRAEEAVIVEKKPKARRKAAVEDDPTG